jgi:hypothetical protein
MYFKFESNNIQFTDTVYKYIFTLPEGYS